MAVASLVLAILAIVIAIAIAVYTRRQAVAAEGVLAIEAARHLAERRPQLSGRVERIGNGAYQLAVTLDSDDPLTAAEFYIPGGQGVTFDRSVYGVVPLRARKSVALRAFAHNHYSGAPTGSSRGGSVTWKDALFDAVEDVVYALDATRGDLLPGGLEDAGRYRLERSAAYKLAAAFGT